MFHLRAYGTSRDMADAGAQLERSGVARHVSVATAVLDGHSVLTAEVPPEFADDVLGFMHDRGVTPDDVALARVEEIGRSPRARTGASLIWADVVGQANVNARPLPRYVVLMIVAGVIAAYGVIEVNSILIVGAMAVSPDVLPVAAACVALVSARPRLAGRAIITLAIGLGSTCAAAAALAGSLDLLDLLPAGYQVDDAAILGLTTVNDATVGVALAAGVAAMLAIETRASSAVGVAISITTIPAAAYFGVAIVVGSADKAFGALAVLGVNVVMLLVAGTTTLIVQRRLGDRDHNALTTGSGGMRR
jgi:uncharacterized hydrophobic protein (TIGR00271 family)